QRKADRAAKFAAATGDQRASGRGFGGHAEYLGSERGMDHRGTPAGEQPAAVFDAECILGAAIVGVKTFGVDVQMAVQSIDVFLEQLHVAQADQATRTR